MIDLLLAAAIGRFPCAVEVDISGAEPWRREIIQVLGTYSALSGTTFTEGTGGIKIVTGTLRKGVLGTWLLDTITVTSLPLSRSQRLAVFAHELGHAYWMGHSDDPHDIMYPTVTQNHSLSKAEQVFVADAGCRVYS